MMSAEARAARRGAMAEAIFLAEMDRLGFELASDWSGCLWAWVHPATPGRVYSMGYGQQYADTFRRLSHELEAARDPPP